MLPIPPEPPRTRTLQRTTTKFLQLVTLEQDKVIWGA